MIWLGLLQKEKDIPLNWKGKKDILLIITHYNSLSEQNSPTIAEDYNQTSFR